MIFLSSSSFFPLTTTASSFFGFAGFGSFFGRSIFGLGSVSVEPAVVVVARSSAFLGCGCGCSCFCCWCCFSFFSAGAAPPSSFFGRILGPPDERGGFAGRARASAAIETKVKNRNEVYGANG